MPASQAEKVFVELLKGTSMEKLKCFANGVTAQGLPLPSVIMGVTLPRVRTLAREEVARRRGLGEGPDAPPPESSSIPKFLLFGGAAVVAWWLLLRKR